MSEYRVSEAARTDLEEIWLFIARDNVEAADRFIRAIVRRFPQIAAMPNIGRKTANPRERYKVGRVEDRWS